MLVYKCLCITRGLPVRVCPALLRPPGLPQPYYNPENFFGNKQDIFTRCERD